MHNSLRFKRVELLGSLTELPDRFNIDRRLIAGSAIFGIGCGLSGICPGPALLQLTGGTVQSDVFVCGVMAACRHRNS